MHLGGGGGSGKDLFAVGDERGKHKDLLGEVGHMLGSGNQRGCEYSGQVVLVHLVDRVVGGHALQVLQHILQAAVVSRWQTMHCLGHEF